MADGVFNISKGRLAEFYWRVENNDPSTSGLVIVALKAAGLEADATLQDYATLSAILAAANDEATNTGYARKVLTDSNLSALAVDNTNNRMPVDFADPLWTAVAAAGGAWGKLVVCYDNDTGVTNDALLIPMTHHDFAVTPDGSDVSGQVNAIGFAYAA